MISMSAVRNVFWQDVARGCGGRSLPEEVRLQRVHSCDREQRRRIVLRGISDAGWSTLVVAFLEETRVGASGSHQRSLGGVYARRGQQTWPESVSSFGSARSVRIAHQMTSFRRAIAAHSGGSWGRCWSLPARPAPHLRRTHRLPPLLGALTSSTRTAAPPRSRCYADRQAARLDPRRRRIPAPPTPDGLHPVRSIINFAPGQRSASSGSRSSTTTCPARTREPHIGLFDGYPIGISQALDHALLTIVNDDAISFARNPLNPLAGHAARRPTTSAAGRARPTSTGSTISPRSWPGAGATATRRPRQCSSDRAQPAEVPVRDWNGRHVGLHVSQYLEQATRLEPSTVPELSTY